MASLIYIGDTSRTWDATATAASGGAAPHELGAVGRAPLADGLGDRYFVFVKNVSGAAITQGEVAEIVAAGGWSVQVGSTANGNKAELAGVVQLAGGLPDGRSGWVQCWGRGVILADATGFSAGDLLRTDASGHADVVAAVTDNVVAVGRATSGASAVAAADITIRTA
jgi:hypothetical protein